MTVLNLPVGLSVLTVAIAGLLIFNSSLSISFIHLGLWMGIQFILLSFHFTYTSHRAISYILSVSLKSLNKPCFLKQYSYNKNQILWMTSKGVEIKGYNDTKHAHEA